MVAAGIMN